MHRIVARVSFVTGWAREYVLLNLTFAQLIRYYEYACEWQEESARMQAAEIGIAIGVLRRKGHVQHKAQQVIPDLGTDGGITNLLRMNQ